MDIEQRFNSLNKSVYPKCLSTFIHKFSDFKKSEIRKGGTLLVNAYHEDLCLQLKMLLWAYVVNEEELSPPEIVYYQLMLSLYKWKVKYLQSFCMPRRKTVSLHAYRKASSLLEELMTPQEAYNILNVWVHSEENSLPKQVKETLRVYKEDIRKGGKDYSKTVLSIRDYRTTSCREVDSSDMLTKHPYFSGVLIRKSRTIN